MKQVFKYLEEVRNTLSRQTMFEYEGIIVSQIIKSLHNVENRINDILSDSTISDDVKMSLRQALEENEIDYKSA